MREIDSSKAKGYITKSEEFLEMARIAHGKGKYNGAVVSSIHSAINALDALTTFYLKQRSSGQHDNVLSLIQGLFKPDEYIAISMQFNSLLSLKNASEYQPDLMKESDADKSIKSAERILSKVQAKLQGKI